MALELEKQLLTACEEGRLDKVRGLVNEQGADLSCRDQDGDTPLHLACYYGCTEIVRFLTIDKQCDVECRNNNQNTPLHSAALRGHLDTVKLLIDDVHCDPTVKGQYGRTPLHKACDKGHLDITKYLIDEVHVDPMCNDDELGSTPLHLASSFGYTHIVRFLTIGRQMNAECRTNDQNTPLHHAALGGHLDIVKLLIDDLHCDPTVKDQYGRTPLHITCGKGHLDITKYLIDEVHVDPMCKDDEQGSTPLHLASELGHTHIVRFLTIERQIDAECRTNNQDTPLHRAALGGHLDIVKLLIDDVHCDPTVKGQYGRTPLHTACQEGHLDIAKYLIDEQHADPLYQDINNVTPLHMAAKNRHTEVVKYLVGDKKCDPRPKTKKDKTPYDLARDNGHMDVALYLESQGGGPSDGPTSTISPTHSPTPSTHPTDSQKTRGTLSQSPSSLLRRGHTPPQEHRETSEKTDERPPVGEDSSATVPPTTLVRGEGATAMEQQGQTTSKTEKEASSTVDERPPVEEDSSATVPLPTILTGGEGTTAIEQQGETTSKTEKELTSPPADERPPIREDSSATVPPTTTLVQGDGATATRQQAEAGSTSEGHLDSSDTHQLITTTENGESVSTDEETPQSSSAVEESPTPHVPPRDTATAPPLSLPLEDSSSQDKDERPPVGEDSSATIPSTILTGGEGATAIEQQAEAGSTSEGHLDSSDTHKLIATTENGESVLTDEETPQSPSAVEESPTLHVPPTDTTTAPPLSLPLEDSGSQDQTLIEHTPSRDGRDTSKTEKEASSTVDERPPVGEDSSATVPLPTILTGREGATAIEQQEHTPSRDEVVGDIIRTSQTGQSVETIIQPGAMSSPAPHIEMVQLNRKLAKEVQEYKTALAHSQQTQQSLTQALAEKELQLSARPAKMVDLQATLEQQGAQLHKERSQREEAEKQLKTNQMELHDLQQKVDELQEKNEKLEGQLQFTQDSITEIQEQLTPPEKVNQAIQTQPSYLQISAQMLDKEREFQATLEQRETQLDWERQRREEVEQQFKENQRKLSEMQLQLQEREKLAGQLKREVDKMQLQINELRGREKLAGQSTGEAALTTKETQEQLSQPKKRDHIATGEATTTTKEIQEQLTPPEKRDQTYTELPILQTSEGQSTGEAALTTKEIQEQLTPPEKRNQSVQTYTEPPLLQTSEATQATGEAAITTKEIQEQLTPPEKRDKTYTEPPLLQTEVFQLRGVHVVGETTFTATRHSTTLNWEEYGFMLHIPEGALPPGVEQCRIHVKATIRGQFQLPDDHELVSAVFWIWCRHKLSKPATMEIEHCAAITTDKQCSSLTFIRTQCSQEKLPYTFKPVPEGVFTPGSCYGSLSLSCFSGYGIASRKRPRRKPHRSAKKPKLSEVFSGHATEDDDDLFVQERYCAQLYSTSKGVNVWKVYFVLTMDLKADMKAVEKHFSGVANLEIEPFEVMLEEDEITLDIPEDGVHTKEGWMIYPSYSPIITKNRVKYFDRRGRSLPMCELVVKWQDDEGKPSWLAYRVRIKGVCASRNFFWLTINPTSEIGQQSSQDTVRSLNTLSQDQRPSTSIGGSPRSSTVSVKPELKALVLIPVSAWYELGLQLDLSDVDLDCIRDNYYKDSNTCKIEMFKLWLKKYPSSSYEQLAKALTAIGEKTMADNLCKKYGCHTEAD